MPQQKVKATVKIKGCVLMRSATSQLPAMGFTLMEMMVVLILVGIMTAMATPYFLTAVRQKEVNAVAQNITDTVNYAAAEAGRRSQFIYIYPAYYRIDGKLNGPALSWREANGILAFAHKLQNFTGIDLPIYHRDEEIAGKQLTGSGTKQKINLAVAAVPGNSNNIAVPGEWGIILSADGMRIMPNFHLPTAGISAVAAVITVRNNISPKICQVAWINAGGTARNCAQNRTGEKDNPGIKIICTCTDAAF